MYIPVQIHAYRTYMPLLNECVMPKFMTLHRLYFCHSSYMEIVDLQTAHRGIVSSTFATLDTKRICIRLKMTSERERLVIEFNNQPNYQSELSKPSTYLNHAVSSRTCINSCCQSHLRECQAASHKISSHCFSLQNIVYMLTPHTREM